MKTEKLRELEQVRKYVPMQYKIERAKKMELLPKNIDTYSEVEMEVRACIDTVCEAIGLSFELVFKKTRKMEICLTRQALIASVFNEFSKYYHQALFSRSSLGDMLGKDHATIIHCIKKFEDIDPKYGKFEFETWEKINTLVLGFMRSRNVEERLYGYTICKSESNGVQVFDENMQRMDCELFSIMDARIFIKGVIAGKSKLSSPTPTKHVLEYDTNI
jgi:hypothetical protein